MAKQPKEVHDIKIAYIGGGSKYWARMVMSDLAMCPHMKGELVLHDVHMPAVAERVKGVQFAQHLFGCLEAGGSSVQLDDIAELTVERAAPRVLHADMHVMLEFEKVETGHR